MTEGRATDPGYVVERIPPGRRAVLDRLAGASRRFQVHALVELDVSRARAAIRTAPAPVTWTAFVIASVARAVAAHPELNARMSGSRVITFDRVDVGATVERSGEGRPVLDVVVVRGADRLDCVEITRMLHEAKTGPALKHPQRGLVTQVVRLPAPLRRTAIRLVARRPAVSATFGPAVGVTSIGMFTHGWGWAIPLAPLTVVATVGAVVDRPVVVDGVVEARPMLPLTLTFDHAVVDGAPAARFVETLRDLVETATVLHEPAAGPSGDPGQMSRKTSIVAPSALRRSARSS